MKKQIYILALVVLMLGVVSAGDRTLYDGSSLWVPGENVVAGSYFEVGFDFAYLDDHVNPESSPLIIQLNFSSDDKDYPVWRNDFEVSGYIERYALWGMIPLSSVYFECNNSEVQLIEHSLDAQTVYADNGTFYCFSESGDLELEEYDEVFLNIAPNYAIYPGSYGMNVSMFYLTDERAPFVNITNKGLFDGYYRENDNVLVLATIDDVSGVAGRWSSTVINTSSGSEIFFLVPQDILEGEYPFSQNTPGTIVEGDYELFVFAEDEYGNKGNDSVVLKIDMSAPEIELINLDEVVGEILSVNVSIVDEKAGVDNSSVEYRLREMNGSSVCPGSGVGSWDCYDSGWLSLLNVSEGLFGVEMNTSETGLNGEYWLEIRASDILGNMGVLD